jgi:hypothetical protein
MRPQIVWYTAVTEIRKQFGLESAQVVLELSMPNTTLIYAGRTLAEAAAVTREAG